MDYSYSIEALKDTLEDAIVERSDWIPAYRERGYEGDRKRIEELEGLIRELNSAIEVLKMNQTVRRGKSNEQKNSN